MLIDKKVFKLNFDSNNKKKYIGEPIQNSAVHAHKAEDYPLGVYYQVAQKYYP